MKQYRPTPRRRDAPRWTPKEWADASLALLRRSGGRCEHCGELLHGRAERHHRKRRRDGGDSLDNLILLAPAHHVPLIHRHVTWAQERGLIVMVALDPETEPVWYMNREWMLLDAAGGLLTSGPPDARG